MIAWLLTGLLLFQGMGSGPRGGRKAGGPKVAAPAFSLREVPMGLTAKHRYGDGTSKYILSMTGNGVATIDFDNDGKLDLLFADGVAPVLYRNSGKGFVDASAGSGFAARAWGQGVCAGDFDNDGWIDVALTYYGASRLYRNEQGKFRDVTAAAGMPVEGKRFSTGCAFVDWDRDGRLDLVISNYVAFDLATAGRPGATKYCTWEGLEVFCGPRGFPTDRPILYRQRAPGRFEDVTATALKGVEGLHYGLGVVTSDFDGDGWTDVYIACDSTPGMLLRNNRDGTFTDVAVEAGAAYGADGEELGSMGVAAVDFDGDGRMDLVKTNFVDETPSLYRNLGDWLFVDVTQETGLGGDATAVGWGLGVVDFDFDGRPDFVMANGHIYPELGARFRQTKSVYWNGGGVFAVKRMGAPMASRGLAVGDFDGDGMPEIVVANLGAGPTVLRVESPRGKGLAVQLEGTRSNRSALGARVTLREGGKAWSDEVRSGGSYASQSDLGLTFGLGEATGAEVEVRWPNGETEKLGRLAAGARYRVKEGAGVVGKTAWK
jgi:enediyne biosynthesis protein E4